jgi:hypothetical protein
MFYWASLSKVAVQRGFHSPAIVSSWPSHEKAHLWSEPATDCDYSFNHILLMIGFCTRFQFIGNGRSGFRHIGTASLLRLSIQDVGTAIQASVGFWLEQASAIEI